MTSYPTLKDKFVSSFDYQDERVVQDGNLITSQGPGTAFEFALKIIEYLEGSHKMKEVQDKLLVKL